MAPTTMMNPQATRNHERLKWRTKEWPSSAVLDMTVAEATAMSRSESTRNGMLKSGASGFAIRVRSRSGSNTLQRRYSRLPFTRERDRLSRRLRSVSRRP